SGPWILVVEPYSLWESPPFNQGDDGARQTHRSLATRDQVLHPRSQLLAAHAGAGFVEVVDSTPVPAARSARPRRQRPRAGHNRGSRRSAGLRYMNQQSLSSFIWSVADLLRGDFKQSEYGRVILPLTVLRRLDCVLEPVKPAMLEKYEQVKGKVDNFGPVLDRLSEIEDLWNISPFDFGKLPDDPDHTADNLRASIHGFAPGIRDTIDKFDFGAQTPRLDKANLLYPVV